MVILDAGHGGMHAGRYLTPGKRWPEREHVLGETFFEGMWNRWVVNRLIERLDRLGVAYAQTSPGPDDRPITKRSRFANLLYAAQPDAWLLSIHANAGGGRGPEVFTSPGDTAADSIATTVIVRVASVCGIGSVRSDWSDGDVDKEARFAILTDTACPAVLLEVGFMDDAEFRKVAFTPEFLDALTDRLAHAVLDVAR